MIEVSREDARRIAVRAQALDGSADGVLETIRRLGSVQMDPISTVAPAQHMVLFSRLGPYDVAESTRRLLDALVTNAPPKDREVEAARKRARAAERFATAR